MRARNGKELVVKDLSDGRCNYFHFCNVHLLVYTPVISRYPGLIDYTGAPARVLAFN